MRHNDPSTIGETMFLVCLFFVALALVATLKHFTAPAVNAQMAARAEYRQNLIDNNHTS